MKRLLLGILFTAFVLFAHDYALLHGLYWQIRWLDTPMHYAGGVGMGLIALGIVSILLARFPRGKAKSVWPRRLLVLFFCVGFAATIGIAWEWYEFLGDHIGSHAPDFLLMQPSLADTMKDLFFDVAGGFTVGYLSFFVL